MSVSLGLFNELGSISLEYQQSYFILVIGCTAVNKFAVGSPVSQVATVTTEQLVILEGISVFSITIKFTVNLKKK